MRIEFIYPSWKISEPQWYINCAHVEIIGPGGGKPSLSRYALARRESTQQRLGNPTEFARFPGTYKMDDPGELISQDPYPFS